MKLVLGLTCDHLYFFSQQGQLLATHREFISTNFSEEAIFVGTHASFSGIPKSNPHLHLVTKALTERVRKENSVVVTAPATSSQQVVVKTKEEITKEKDHGVVNRIT